MDEPGYSQPVHLQRLEKALNLDSFLDYVEHAINQPISDDESSDTDPDVKEIYQNGIKRTKEEIEVDKSEWYNFSGVQRKRRWLKEALLSSSEDEDDDLSLNEDYLNVMIKEHKIKKYHQEKYLQNDENRDYMYYSAGLLSKNDKYPEHQKYMAGSRRKKNKEKERLKKIKIEEEIENPLQINEDSMASFPDDLSDDLNSFTKIKSKGSKKDKKPKKMDAQALAIKRHRLWVMMAKKEVGRSQKSKACFRKEVLQNCKKMATGCMRHCRQKALQSQKTVKDKVWMLKRLTRTMQGEWKKFDRLMKEQSKRAEKEAEEQRKIDKEIVEAKRQQRKVNFLITLPELYAHFMKNKMNSSDDENLDDDTNSILKQLEDDPNAPVSTTVVDDYDSDAMKAQAMKTAQEAYTNQQSRINMFGREPEMGQRSATEVKEHKQPSIFKGTLKSYQMKGMNWLANLYYFGINGILADEMGLGKTVQSVAFLGHICEEYDTWGPFLIVTPASTLHNWNGEINRFVPEFKTVPYWGNPEERKNLRKFFDGKNLGSRSASFHIVITSYQIVIQDFKFLNRLKWNYMILDEAQAIKSINSQRWKLLLGFSCRNRLLLSGTPIQNSMAELWALLHFIMPTLFDSHLWFNEWFSKDIETHVENKTAIDEKHLNRLHLILKPFMLRRVKTEVENELSDKIEIMMYCPLTLRQKFLYNGLKNKISIDELLRTSMGTSSQLSSVTTSLMNLVMQFRKVCNHPELFERREVKSPYTFHPEPYVIPKLVYREAILNNINCDRHYLLNNTLSLFHPFYIHSCLYKNSDKNTIFSFLPFINMSCQELSFCAQNILERWRLLIKSNALSNLIYHTNTWHSRGDSEKSSKAFNKNSTSNRFGRSGLILDLSLSQASTKAGNHLSDYVFTSYNSSIYSFINHTFHFMPETTQHRKLRSKRENSKLIEITNANNEIKTETDIKNEISDNYTENCSNNTFNIRKNNTAHKLPKNSKINKHKEELITNDNYSNEDGVVPNLEDADRFPNIRHCQPTSIPKFLLQICSKASSLTKEIYCVDRSSAWSWVNHLNCGPSVGYDSLLFGSKQLRSSYESRKQSFQSSSVGGIAGIRPPLGWSSIIIPDKHSLIMDSGKLIVLDSLLSKLKAGGHRVLIYSQMTKVIDLLEEYMWHRQHKYMRLDGSSKISDRRDMVADFQTKTDIFVFLLSTRAGGVGINLTAADTVIFYDSDWNPTVDQQAMDRAHRLGQTKQVTVFRLVCKGTIEERILQRAREKSEIQRMVISGGNFKPDTLKPKEVVSLLLDDDIEKQYRARQQEKRAMEDHKLEINREKMRERMRKRYAEKKHEKELSEKKRKLETDDLDMTGEEETLIHSPPSPTHSEVSITNTSGLWMDDGSNDGQLVVDVESSPSSSTPSTPAPSSSAAAFLQSSTPSSGRGSTTVRGHRKRGRPKGSGVRSRFTHPDTVQSDTSSSLNTSHTSLSDSPTSTNTPKRGRGRPRLLPLGPGHQGTRSAPSLPVALGTSLNPNQSPQDNSTNKSFNFYG